MNLQIKEKTKIILLVLAGLLVAGFSIAMQYHKEITGFVTKGKEPPVHFYTGMAIPMNLEDPSLERLDISKAANIKGAWYDKRILRLVVNSNAYVFNLYYCNVTPDLWEKFKAAESIDDFYKEQIDGVYDCRAGEMY